QGGGHAPSFAGNNRPGGGNWHPTNSPNFNRPATRPGQGGAGTRNDFNRPGNNNFANRGDFNRNNFNNFNRNDFNRNNINNFNRNNFNNWNHNYINHDWHHGYWGGNWHNGWYSHPWAWWGAGLATGAVAASVFPWSYGYYDYSNPYY